MSNALDPDQDCLGPNCLQRLADNKKMLLAHMSLEKETVLFFFLIQE